MSADQEQPVVALADRESIVEKIVEVDVPKVEPKRNAKGQTDEEVKQAQAELDEQAKQLEEGDQSSADIIDLLEVHDDEQNLLEKLGIKKKYEGIPYEQQTKDQKAETDRAAEELKMNQKKADLLIKAAENKLEEIRKATQASIQEVKDLKQLNLDKQIEVNREKNRGAIIDANYQKQLRRMRQSRIGEIHWIIVESREDDNYDMRDEYTWIIHNYLMVLFLEDHEETDLKEEIRDRQQQIHDNFTKQFNEFVDPIRKAKNPPKEFRKLFPKPEPKGENAEKFHEFYEMYETWVKEEFDGDDFEEDEDILQSTVGDFESSVGASVNVQEVVVPGSHNVKTEGIAEEDEDEN